MVEPRVEPDGVQLASEAIYLSQRLIQPPIVPESRAIDHWLLLTVQKS